MGYFSANWVVTGMSRGMRTQQKMLQKKLANISADSEDVQAHTEPELVEPQLVTPPVKKPAKKNRKRRGATMRIATQNEPSTRMTTDAVEASSVTECDTELEPQTDNGCGELTVIADKLLPSTSDPHRAEDHVAYVDSVCAIQASNNTSCMGKSDACKMCDRSEDRRTNDIVDTSDCNNRLGEANISLQKALASSQEAEGCCKFKQPPEDCCRKSGALGHEERRQMLGEWPETETEDIRGDLDNDGMWDDWSDDDDDNVPFEKHRRDLLGLATGSSSNVESGRCRKSSSQDDGANGWFSDQIFLGHKSSPDRSENDIQDEWMVPFDELIRGPKLLAMPHGHDVLIIPSVQQISQLPAAGTSAGGPVCIWNARPDGCGNVGGLAGLSQDGGKDIFTDGQQIFQPVPSQTGQALFTDGKQLYASVCVVLSQPNTEAALASESQTPVFGFVPDSDSDSDSNSECF
eukprot:CAMPEP_0172941708 /NCGR_PEP_ID=MMETSP1075-20121228/224678_1 /TAXON_ID=2916 /ORGANISM="Ceratium fusus, Strain PA161109" /LENGTH=461 /DNA_ID=CAMNT_0013803123 /DNA_START=59 /DNA_END=1444 /DNA_ORIENTATION=-